MLLTAALVTNVLAGATFLAVGAGLLHLRPPRDGVTWLAGYAVLTGAAQLLGNLGSMLPGLPWLVMASWPLFALAPAALLMGIARYVRSTRARWEWLGFVPAATGALLLVVAPDTMLAPTGALARAGFLLWLFPAFAGTAIAAHVLLRHRRRRPSEEAQLETALLLLALLPYLAYVSSLTLSHFVLYALVGGFVIYTPAVDFGHIAVTAACLAASLAMAATLLRAGDVPARRLALFTFAVALLGTTQTLVSGELAAFSGALRIVAALGLGYGLVKFGIFGIEARVKWTLSRGALVGIFGTVFFIVDQGAQFLVGEIYGALAGIVAALLLAAGLVPLRRLTDRLADRLLPGVAQTPEYDASRRVVVYRAAYESASRDGVMTEREERILATLRLSLKLSEAEVREAEQGASPAVAPGRIGATA